MSVATAVEAADPDIALRTRMLVVSFGRRVRACSWAVLGGGFASASRVAWIEVRDDELRPPVEPCALARERLRAEGFGGDVVTLLTSRRVASYDTRALEERDLWVRAVGTVGLGNALRAGDPVGVAGRIGTINLLVYASVPLTDEALLEANAIATEAKTAAVLEGGVVSRRTGRAATGTGTDCTVIACATSAGRRERYAGKHTRLGALVGAVAHDVVRDGVRRWLAENAR